MAIWEVLDDEIKLIEVTYAGTHEKAPYYLVDLRVIGPLANRHRALDALKELGFMDPTDSIPWREAFPDIREEHLPGISLLGGRTKEGMTQIRLSELTGIPQRHLSMMEHGKRPIGKEMAKRLGKVLNISYKVFL